MEEISVLPVGFFAMMSCQPGSPGAKRKFKEMFRAKEVMDYF